MSEITKVEQEQLKTLDAQEAEQKLIEEAERKAADPFESASLGYHLYSSKFKEGIEYLSSRGAKRLLKALVDRDLQDGRYKLSEVEKKMLEIGNFALECKFLMILNTYNQARDVLEKAADPNIELTEQEKADLAIIKGEQNVG